MPKRFSKHGASFCAAHGATSATPAIVAQASSLKNPIPKISDVADCRARPQKKNHRGTETPRRTRFFSRGRDGVYPHPYSELCSGVNPLPTSRQDLQHHVNKRTGGVPFSEGSPIIYITERTGGVSPPNSNRRLMPPKSTCVPPRLRVFVILASRSVSSSTENRPCANCSAGSLAVIRIFSLLFATAAFILKSHCQSIHYTLDMKVSATS